MEPRLMYYYIEPCVPIKRKIITNYAGIFFPIDQIKNPDRKWWQLWKPRTITNPAWFYKMSHVWKGEES